MLSRIAALPTPTHAQAHVDGGFTSTAKNRKDLAGVLQHGGCALFILSRLCGHKHTQRYMYFALGEPRIYCLYFCCSPFIPLHFPAKRRGQQEFARVQRRVADVARPRRLCLIALTGESPERLCSRGTERFRIVGLYNRVPTGCPAIQSSDGI